MTKELLIQFLEKFEDKTEIFVDFRDTLIDIRRIDECFLTDKAKQRVAVIVI